MLRKLFAKTSIGRIKFGRNKIKITLHLRLILFRFYNDKTNVSLQNERKTLLSWLITYPSRNPLHQSNHKNINKFSISDFALPGHCYLSFSLFLIEKKKKK